MVLGRNLEQAWESLVVLVDAGSDALGDLPEMSDTVSQFPSSHAGHLEGRMVSTYVLVDQNDRNILPMLGELVECFLDSGLLGFGVHDEVVLLRARSFGDVLHRMSVDP